jgi:hypothetical protein
VTLCTLPFSSGDVVKTLKRLDSASFSLNLFGDIPYFDTEGQIKLCQREREREREFGNEFNCRIMLFRISSNYGTELSTQNLGWHLLYDFA